LSRIDLRTDQTVVTVTYAGVAPFAGRMPIFLARRRAMVEPKKNDKPITNQFESGIDPDNSLLPMLIGGLVLIVIGAIIVMMFV
jgi:hypothetical protein